MALDSRAKRQAVIGNGRAWLRAPFPNAAKNAEWRASVGSVYPVAAFAVGLDPVATITGTTAFTEAQVQAGGETIVITIVNDTWPAAGAAFNAQRQNILNGISSAQSEITGWNNEVRDKEVVGSVVRTSSTVVTITLTAASAYNVAQNETITVVVPDEALVTTTSAVTATPTIGVTADAALLADHILNFSSLSRNLAFVGNPARRTEFASVSNIIKMVGTVPPLAFILIDTGGSLLQENGAEIEN